MLGGGLNQGEKYGTIQLELGPLRGRWDSLSSAYSPRRIKELHAAPTEMRQLPQDW